MILEPKMVTLTDSDEDSSLCQSQQLITDEDDGIAGLDSR